MSEQNSKGKSAKKAAEEIAKHGNDNNFIRASNRSPPPSMGLPFVHIESRKRIEEEIMESLKNSAISKIAIWGMGGVGKTTMAERIRKRVKEESLFDEIVMMVVGQHVDMIKIQEEIAELLGLTLNVETMSARAHQLRKRLIDANRKIIILDDVQKRLELEDLGVPAESDFEVCKILLTTRLKKTCEEMKAHKVIAMKVLNKEEAWSLFKNRAGNVVEDPVLRPVAEEIVAECKGLPIALVTVGEALKNQTMFVLKDSLLKQSIDFQEVPAPSASMASTSIDFQEVPAPPASMASTSIDFQEVPAPPASMASTSIDFQEVPAPPASMASTSIDFQEVPAPPASMASTSIDFQDVPATPASMASCGMGGCLPSPFKEIGKCIQCLWPFLKPNVDYWWCFDDNIQQLNLGIRDLDGTKENITSSWSLTPICPPKVEKWLNDSTKKLEEARRILPDGNIPGNIPKWDISSRYSLGKNAKETAEEITKLLNEGDLIQKDHPAPSPAMASPPTRLTMDFGSRKGIEEDIIKSLKESSVDMIGICGMGGIGKTTMAQRIRKRAKDENLFDEVVMITVSQKIDMLKIQEEIAEWLKLKFYDRYLSDRAAKLRTRLMDPKRKLVVLDDVWESLKLDDLGVPFECERCKILLTTRSKDVCKKMGAQKIIAMEILTEEEAWILFKDKTGDCVEDLTLKSMAKDVAAECKCLPLALVTVGLALRDNTNIRKWKDSLSQLKKSNPSGFSEVLMDVYKPLKLSYDCLDNNSERHLFLLCCLFPENFDISVEQLTWYSMGLGLFDDFHNIEEARNRTHTLVEKLESRFLLIDVEKYGKKGLEVKMHDVVRDVAIYIGSKEEKGFLKSLTSIKNSSDVNCIWMSVEISNERMEVPVVLSQFSELRLLLLSFNKSDKDDTSDNDIYYKSFEGMEHLNVLSFGRSSIGSLPPSLGSLKNLQTLCLVDCGVETISVIVELTSLKIFSCCDCHNITELPEDIGRLKDLRLLELTGCDQLQTIPFGVISNFSLLEELKMLGSFSRWEAGEKGKERRNALLEELEYLGNLCCLEIDIDDCTLSEQEIRLSQNLVKYCIRIGSYDNSSYYYFNKIDYEKVMILNLPSDIGAVGKWIQKLVRNTELLHLQGDGSGSNNFNIAEIEYLRELRVWGCSTVKKLDMVFCSLETLILYHLKNLEEICIIPNQNVSLCNLKSIKISTCHKLRSLLSVSVARRSLLQLEVLNIRNCASLEEVFWNEGTDENTNDCIEFPKLKKLKLRFLRKLNSLSFLKDVSFGNLKSIYISHCDKLRSLFSVSVAKTSLLQLENLEILYCKAMEHVFWNEGTYNNTDVCIEFPKLKELTLKDLPKLNILFPTKDVFLGNLKSMFIYGCDKLRSLFSVSVAKTSLLQLEVLEIQHCDAMEHVFWNEGTDDNTDVCIEFLKLKKLKLKHLPNLTALCQELKNVIVNFPNLTEMNIGGLPSLEYGVFPLSLKKLTQVCIIKIKKISNLKHLFSGSVARTILLQLEVLRISSCDAMEQVFWNEGTNDNTDGCIEFPKLKELTLQDLPNLTAFCQGLENKSIKFPNLTTMSIGGFPKLNSLSPLNSERVAVHDQNTSLHFFCNRKVETGCVNSLRLHNFQDNIKNIWCHQIPNNFFNNLKTLEIRSINGIRSLMSTSIAKNLTSLESLFIFDCGELIEVIEKDEDDYKQAVAVFTTLTNLHMCNLPKLKKFWHWNYVLDWAYVRIDNCPIMETSTWGPMNAFINKWIQ